MKSYGGDRRLYFTMTCPHRVNFALARCESAEDDRWWEVAQKMHDRKYHGCTGDIKTQSTKEPPP